MSKLAHSDDDGMERIEAAHYVRDELPTALTVVKAIAAAGGRLPTSDAYLTKKQMVYLCQEWLKRRK